MISPSSIQNNFSGTLDLYLNNASRSPLPLSHSAILDAYINDWKSGTHDPYHYNFSVADALKSELSRFIQSPESQIAIGTNVANGFAAITQGLTWNKGDTVLLVSDDYPSVTLPFIGHPTISTAWIPTHNGRVSLDDIIPLITKQTKAIALSWVHYTTGHIQPIQEIGTWCRQHNIQLYVDATQALGVIPIISPHNYMDAMIASLYKWCFCPPGMAISVFSDSLLSTITPISSGVFSQDDRVIRAFPNRPSTSAQKLEYGNHNILGIMLGHETFRWFNTIGANTIHAILSHLSKGIIELINQYDGECPYPYNGDYLSGIVSFKHPHPDPFMATLTQHGGTATYRHGLIRLSPGIYQTETTLNKLADVFDQCITKVPH